MFVDKWLTLIISPFFLIKILNIYMMCIILLLSTGTINITMFTCRCHGNNKMRFLIISRKLEVFLILSTAFRKSSNLCHIMLNITINDVTLKLHGFKLEH